MKKIQLISYAKNNSFEDNSIKISDFKSLESLDSFKYNIINLASDGIWQCTKEHNNISPDIDCLNDIISIGNIIEDSTKSVMIICLPQNINYFYTLRFGKREVTELKDAITVMKGILKKLLPFDDYNIVYENNHTLIENTSIESSFYFKKKETLTSLTESQGSEKSTTMKKDNIILTTLNITTDKEILLEFINMLEDTDNKSNYPEWLYNYNFFDDSQQKKAIQNAKEKINKQEDIISICEKKLEENLKIKSMLCTNSSELVSSVFKVLEYLFDISLADFVDKKQEDFLFKKDAFVYIGEIKGVNSNVKYEHISQLEVHNSKYLDNHNDTENFKIKKLLIINYEREKPVDDRDEINNMQVSLAEKYGTLIIDTKSLLTIYEKVLNNIYTKTDVINYINKTAGTVKLNDIQEKKAEKYNTRYF